MAFWLARKRNGQESNFIQRFDPRFWTINFPRPMMGSVITTGPDSLRVDVEFHHRNALAGLIWESEDRLDHPLLAYGTRRDYSHTILKFRWRSQGVLPLDAVHGPTLTIEGTDSAGNARSWYVRLWNYATGNPEDATITLPFSSLSGGWDVADTPDPLEPTQIERMFISLVPPMFDPASSDLLPFRADGWVEMSEIDCDGENAMLQVGDVLVPPHGIRMATAYDDLYNQTPARLLRNIRGLGYRDELIHYIGMSHYFRLAPGQNGTLLPQSPVTFAEPARRWHQAFLSQAQEQGLHVILSFSFELLAQHCPEDWKQKAHDGSAGLTGWDPPSALLSPAHQEVRSYLTDLASQLGQMLVDAGLPVKLQVGEPWWWVDGNFAPCIYDDTMRALIEPGVPDITDMRVPLSAQQLAVLDLAASQMGTATSAIIDQVKANLGSAAEIYLLAFTPTVLHQDMPEMARLNLPSEWAYPRFDRLQLEDYDWLTGGAEALRQQAYRQMDQSLQYPAAKQDYMAGFVLNAEDAEQFWQRIDAALDEAEERGIPRLFVWALPQVCRDGYIRMPTKRHTDNEDDMQAFDDVLYPLALGRDAAVSPEFSTAVTLTASGHERRSSHWSDARLRFDVGPGIRSEAELGTLLQFFRARRGAARGFRLADPFDFSSADMTGTPGFMDQFLGTGDGLAAAFQLVKNYGDGPEPQVRRITRPRSGTVRVSLDGIEVHDWLLAPGGQVVFDQAPPVGAIVRAGFLFDVPVRFAEDQLDIAGSSFAAGEAPSVPLVEVREQA